MRRDGTARPDIVGLPVLVAGAGLSGRAATAVLVELGARVTVTDAVPERLADLPPGALAGAACDLLRGEIVGALARHAPDVPVAEVVAGDDGPMTTAVRRAAAFARPGDVVLLAPAAASMDQFVDYAQRGDAFAGAVAALDDRAGP